MKNLEDILKLGDPRLYKISEPVEADELKVVQAKAEIMSDLVLSFRQKYGMGRAIAAPQIGWFKRLVVMHIEKPLILINPVLFDKSEEMIELWDDCMSFPDLLVKVKRHKSCKLRYRDLDWNEQVWELGEDMSELLQHECDHLDGILATQRALDHHSFALKSQADKLT